MDDRLDILEVLNRYLHAVDTGDITGIEACFTPDAQAEYSGRHVGDTGAEIAGYLAKAGIATGQAWRASTHALANWRIDVDGDRATASTLVEAMLADSPRGSGQIRRRGLNYADELVRGIDGCWRIHRRKHRLLWHHAVEDGAMPD
ncbi:MAG: hypothetical protein JWP35_891 [Caulobacter sp.]|nr:hypothetical protein [Caulobacter sp.]